MVKLPVWSDDGPLWIKNASGVMVPAWAEDACACCGAPSLPNCCALSTLQSLTVNIGGVVGVGNCNCNSINASFTADRVGPCVWRTDITTLLPQCPSSFGGRSICVHPTFGVCDVCAFNEAYVEVFVSEIGPVKTATAGVKLVTGPTSYQFSIGGSKPAVTCNDLFGAYQNVGISFNGPGHRCPIDGCTSGGNLTVSVS